MCSTLSGQPTLQLRPPGRPSTCKSLHIFVQSGPYTIIVTLIKLWHQVYLTVQCMYSQYVVSTFLFTRNGIGECTRIVNTSPPKKYRPNMSSMRWSNLWLLMLYVSIVCSLPRSTESTETYYNSPRRQVSVLFINLNLKGRNSHASGEIKIWQGNGCFAEWKILYILNIRVKEHWSLGNEKVWTPRN